MDPSVSFTPLSLKAFVVPSKDTEPERLTISFSENDYAEHYYDYLKQPNKSYYKEDYGFQKILSTEARQVSMELPSGVSYHDSNGLVLVFEDEEKATAWENDMILWTIGKDQNGKERVCLRHLKAETFYEKLSVVPKMRDLDYASGGFLRTQADPGLLREFLRER